jgi:hypothetical protein
VSPFLRTKVPRVALFGRKPAERPPRPPYGGQDRPATAHIPYLSFLPLSTITAQHIVPRREKTIEPHPPKMTQLALYPLARPHRPVGEALPPASEQREQHARARRDALSANDRRATPYPKPSVPPAHGPHRRPKPSIGRNVTPSPRSVRTRPTASDPANGVARGERSRHRQKVRPSPRPLAQRRHRWRGTQSTAAPESTRSDVANADLLRRTARRIQLRLRKPSAPGRR